MTGRSLLVCLLVAAALASSSPVARAQQNLTTDIPDRYLEGRTAAFVLCDVKRGIYTRFNPAGCATRHSPASTFKIANSLIGLETGVISDEHFVVPWDSVIRPVPAWNRDHDLASAFANSVVPYYQEVARRIGEGLMRKYVRTFAYGNMDVSGPLDRFWLGSSLLISADEQVAFLRKLAGGDLPCTLRSLDLVRHMMVLEQTGGHVLRGKTGFTEELSGGVVGWFVGYVETRDGTYVFAFNMTSGDPKKDGEWIFQNRKSVALSILRDLGVL